MITLPERDKYKILLIEDNLIDRKLIHEFIEQTKLTEFELKDTDRLSSGLQLLADESFDAVLLDLFLPDARKLEALDKIIDCKTDIPIVILTGLGDEDLGISAVRKGAQDYLVKGDFERSLLIRSITYAIERKKAEIALRESEEKYRLLVEKSTEGIAIIQDRRYKYVNPSFAKTVGHSIDELINFSPNEVWALIHPADKKGLEKRNSNIEAGLPITPRYSFRYIRTDGSIRWVEAFVTEISYEEKPAMQVFENDITTHKLAEELLRQKTNYLEERVKELNCLYGVSQLTRDPQRPIDEVLRQVTSLVPQAWQYPSITCAKITLDEKIYMTDNFQETRWKQIAGIIVSDKKIGTIEVFYLKDMPIIFEGPFLKEERDLIDSLARELGNFYERHHMQSELIDSEVRFRQLVNKVRDIIFTIALNGTITSINPAFEVLTGWPRDKVIDKPFTMLVHNEDLPIVIEGFESFSKGEKPVNFDVRIKTKSGKYLVIEGNTEPQFDQGKINGYLGSAHDITERKRMEEDLTKAKARLEYLVTSNPAVIYACELKGEFQTTYMSPNVKEITGYKTSDFVGKSGFWVENLHPEDKPRAINTYKRSISETGYFNDEYRFRHIDGTYRWMKEEANLIRDEKGNPVEIVGYWTDVTPQKKAEEQLRNERENFSNILNSTDDPIYIVNSQHEIEFINAATEREFGSVEGKKCYEYFYDFNEACSWCTLERVINGETLHEEQTLDRNQRTYDMIDTPYRNLDGSFSRLSILRDITERKQTEQSLQESEEKYKNILENLADTVVEMDIEGNFIFVSPQGINLLGMKSEDVIGKNGFEFIHPDDLEGAGESLQRALEGEHVFDFVYRARHKDGHYVPLSASGKIIGEDDNLRVNLLIRDISDKIKAEEALKRSEEKYRMLFESAPIGIGMADLEGNVIEFNQTMLDITGYNSDEIKSISLPDIYVNSEDREKLLQILQESGRVQDFETLLKNKDGMPYVSLLNAVLTNLGEKQVLLTTMRDLTQWRELEKAKRESEEQYKALFENVPIGLYRTTPDGRFIATNSAFLEMVGYYSFDELSLHNAEELSMNIGYSRELFLTAIAKEGIIHGLEQQITRPDGSVISVRENTRAVKDENSSVLYYEGSFEDITVYKEFEQTLKESEEKYRVLFQHAPIGIGFTDFEGNFLAWNSTLMEITGCSEYEIFNIKLSQLFINSEDFQLLIQALQNNKRVQDREVHLKRKKGNNYYALLDIELIEFMEQKTLHITIRDITEQKQAEEALSESEKKYRDLLNNLSDIVVEIDSGVKFTYVSPQAFDILGYSPEELIGRSGLDFIHPDDLEGLMGLLEKIMTKNRVSDFEYRFKHKKGHYVFLSATSKRVVVEEEMKIVSVVRDITERKKAEETLQESEEKYSDLINNLTDTVVELDSEGNFIFISPQIFKISGYNPEELIGTNSLEFIHPDDIETINDVLKKVLEGESVFNYECRGKHKDGYYIWLSISSRVVEAADSSNIVSIIQDITERKQIEVALRESEERFRQLVETSPDGIVLTDLLGDITLINKQGAINLGYKDEHDLISTNIFELIVPEDQELALRTIKETLKTGEGINLEYNFMKKDGTRIPVEMNTTVIKDTTESKRYFMATIRDITERKEAIRLLQRSEERLRTFMDSATESFYLLDSKLNIIDVNKNTENVIGQTKKDIVGKNITYFDPTLKKSDRLDKYKEVLKTGTPLTEENIVLQPKYGEKYFSVRTFKVGEGLGIISREITQQVIAQEALKQSEERFRNIFNRAPIGMALNDLDYHFAKVNEMFCQMLGYTEQELAKMTFKDVTHPDHIKRDVEHAKKLAKKETGLYKTEKRYIKKNKEMFWARTTVTLLLDEKDEPHCYLAMIEDISQQKQAEDEIRKQLMKFKIEDGNLYLISESSPALSEQVFSDLIQVGYSGLAISRMPETEFKRDIDLEFQFLWLSETKKKNSLPPQLKGLEKIIEGIQAKSVIWIDRLDYLVLKNSFEKTLKSVFRWREIAYLNDLVVLLSVDPTTLTKNQIHSLKKETKTVEPRFLVRVPANMLEVLRFVYKRNNLGVKPSYTDIGNELEISKPTTRKRLKELMATGYLNEQKSGNRKLLELTEKGLMVFKK